MNSKTAISYPIKGINAIGLRTLIRREIGRYMSVWPQTVFEPVISTLLYCAVFALALGGAVRTIGDIPYMAFLAPGLIMMAISQNAFANSSTSIVIGKIQGNIVDILMAPLSPGEMVTGYVTGGIIRGLCVGLATTLAMIIFVPLPVHSLFYIGAFAFLGSMMMASMGLVAGIWSEEFDHLASVTSFFITPMTFLSGTFYSIHNLPAIWEKIGYYNPFFHMIDGFRYGFIGKADATPVISLLFLIGVNAVLMVGAYAMLRRGYKIKN